jgi:hypothetical protein
MQVISFQVDRIIIILNITCLITLPMFRHYIFIVCSTSKSISDYMASKGKTISKKVIVKNIEGNCRAVIQNTVQEFARLDCGNKEKHQLRKAVSGSRAAVLSRTACVLFFSSRTSLLSGRTVAHRFCAPVQTGPGAHPASCTPGGRKRAGRDADPSPPSSVEV